MKFIHPLRYPILSALLCLGLSGCFSYVPEHPEKSEAAFNKDRAYCERQAREYARGQGDNVSYVDEMNHAKWCMKGLGWEYNFQWGNATRKKEE